MSYFWKRNSLIFISVTHTKVLPKIDEIQLPKSPQIIRTIIIFKNPQNYYNIALCWPEFEKDTIKVFKNILFIYF